MDEASSHINLIDLPEEVIQCILTHLPARAVVCLEQTCRRFTAITNEPLLWKSYCQDDFRWWDKRHNFRCKVRDLEFVGWKGLYTERYKSSTLCKVAIQELIDESIGRLDRIQTVLDAGYDAKDTLLEIFRNASGSPDYLAQRYWSYITLGSVQRHIALEEISRISSSKHDDHPYERALAALDMFVLDEQERGDVDDIFERLDSYASSVREAYPNIDELPPRQRITTIAEHLLQNNWTGIHDDRDYHSLDHMFLGVALFSESRNSIPIISAIIFCYVARKFGLMAAPCSFPFHVIVLVQSPQGYDLDGNPTEANETPLGPSTTIDSSVHLYMDPFRSSTPVSQETLEHQLRFIAPERPQSLLHSYLAPATPRDITIRAAQNILAAPSHYPGPTIHPISRPSASCAALYTLAILMAESQGHVSIHQLRELFALLVRQLMDHFHFDISLFETYIMPLCRRVPHTGAFVEQVRRMRESDLEPHFPKRRLIPENNSVLYKVGQVFRHRIRNYLAIIYGWDQECQMTEQWIYANQVDGLPKGREQPFYNSIVADDSARYVAEENVILLSKEELLEIGGSDGEALIARFPIRIGRWFKRFDVERGVFVSNIKGEYPDD